MYQKFGAGFTVQEWLRTCTISSVDAQPAHEIGSIQGSKKNPLTLFPALARLERVALDTLGPSPGTASGNTHILGMVYCFPMLCRFRAMLSTTADKVASAFCEDCVFVF